MDSLPEGNIRTVFPPAAYADTATQAGWEIVGSRTFTLAADLEDGKWETGCARSVAKTSEIGGQAVLMVGEKSIESVHLESLRAHADALEISMISEVEADGIECMNVWTAAFRSTAPAKSPRGG